MPSWDAISNFMVERQENREMGQFDHVRMGAQGFVYPPLELSEDQLDDFGLPGIITAGGGLDEQLDTRPSATAVEPTMRDDLRVALARRRTERGRVRDDAHARNDPHHTDAGGARGAFLLARGEVPPPNRHACGRRRLVEQGAEPFEAEVVAGFARRPVAVE